MDERFEYMVKEMERTRQGMIAYHKQLEAQGLEERAQQFGRKIEGFTDAQAIVRGYANLFPA